MSDEQRKDEETEVEAHVKKSAHAEPTEEFESDDEVEAHVRKSQVRYSNVRHG